LGSAGVATPASVAKFSDRRGFATSALVLSADVATAVFVAVSL
jgi:hypothetical protein